MKPSKTAVALDALTAALRNNPASLKTCGLKNGRTPGGMIVWWWDAISRERIELVRNVKADEELAVVTALLTRLETIRRSTERPPLTRTAAAG